MFHIKLFNIFYNKIPINFKIIIRIRTKYVRVAKEHLRRNSALDSILLPRPIMNMLSVNYKDSIVPAPMET